MAIEDGSVPKSKLLSDMELKAIFDSILNDLPELNISDLTNGTPGTSDDDSDDEEMIFPPPENKAKKMVKMVKLPLEPGMEKILLQVTMDAMTDIAIKHPGIDGHDLIRRTSKKLLRMPLLDKKLKTFYAPVPALEDSDELSSDTDDENEINNKYNFMDFWNDDKSAGDVDAVPNSTDNLNDNDDNTSDDEALLYNIEDYFKDDNKDGENDDDESSGEEEDKDDEEGGDDVDSDDDIESTPLFLQEIFWKRDLPMPGPGWNLTSELDPPEQVLVNQMVQELEEDDDEEYESSEDDESEEEEGDADGKPDEDSEDEDTEGNSASDDDDSDDEGIDIPKWQVQRFIRLFKTFDRLGMHDF